MNSEDKVARWHWHATLKSERGSIAITREYEFRLIYRYVPAEQFPFIEGHQFTLEWRDLFFPEGLGDGSRERYITEDFRRDIIVVRAQGVAGVPIWTERIADADPILVQFPQLEFYFAAISRSTYLEMTSTSRFTGVPGSACPSVVSSRVVGINDTSNQSSPRPETVSEIPSTVIEPFSTT